MGQCLTPVSTLGMLHDYARRAPQTATKAISDPAGQLKGHAPAPRQPKVPEFHE